MSPRVGPTCVCGLTADGEAYCWGSSWSGAFGDGTEDLSFRALPDRVQGGAVFSSISAGSYHGAGGYQDLLLGHTCGVTSDGDAYCWGRSTEGQLGVGSTTWRATPQLVSAP